MSAHEKSEEPHATDWTLVRERLLTTLRRSGASAEDAEDLAQEAIARILARPRIFALPQMFTSFAQKVARHLWIDKLRRNSRRPEEDIGDPGGADGRDEPPTLATGSEDRARLAAALEELMPAHREVLDLVIFQALSYEEAALRLGVPRGTVKSRIHYAVRHLRERLGVREEP